MTVSGLECWNWALCSKWFHKPLAGQASPLLPPEGVKSYCTGLEIWAGSGPRNSWDSMPMTGRITEFGGWKGIQYLAGSKDNIPWRCTSRWKRREEAKGETNAKKGGKNTDALAKNLCKLYRRTFPTVLLKWFCLWSRGSQKRPPHVPSMSRAFWALFCSCPRQVVLSYKEIRHSTRSDFRH